MRVWWRYNWRHCGLAFFYDVTPINTMLVLMAGPCAVYVDL